MHRFVSSRLILSLLTAAGLLLFGACDSGGSNGSGSDDNDIPSGKSPVEVTNALDGTITLEASTSDLSDAELVVFEAESEDGVSFNRERTTGSLDLSSGSASATLQNPDNFVGEGESAGSEDDPDGFDSYTINVKPPTGTDPGVDMTVSLFVDGEKIAETSEPRTDGVARQAGKWSIQVTPPS